MAKMDLDRDYTINGQSFKAGTGVDVSGVDGEGNKVDYTAAIKDMQGEGDAQRAYETTHHGAVPMHNDPQEATAQTPTRPLAAPVVKTDVTVAPVTETGDVVEVKDPSANGKGRSADESNKDVLEGSKGSVVANK